MFSNVLFKLKNALATLESVMDVISAFVQWQIALVYLDDSAVFSKSLANYIEQAWRVSRLLYDEEVTLRLKKFKFFVKTIDWLSHVIRSVRLEIAVYTTDALEKLEYTIIRTESLFVLGLS